MPLLYCGIDEAGYGPLLGPLCVSMSALLLPDWPIDHGWPDLWNLLSPLVSKKTSQSRSSSSRSRSNPQRILIDDSKRLKLANSSTTHDPLIHLERGVLTFLSCADHTRHAAPSNTSPSQQNPGSPLDWLNKGDAGFLSRVGIHSPQLQHPWYKGAILPCPRESSIDQLAILTNLLARALDQANTRIIDLWTRAIPESEFNTLIQSTGTKASATELGLAVHLQTIWNFLDPTSAAGLPSPLQIENSSQNLAVRIVCDRQGGRTQYAALIQRALTSSGRSSAPAINILEESPRCSRYQVSDPLHPARQMVVLFMPQAESAHLPVALASMTAKLCRELLMARFNRYWQARLPELKPTAGYRQDGWRFLNDLGPIASTAERAQMVRLA